MEAVLSQLVPGDSQVRLRRSQMLARRAQLSRRKGEAAWRFLARDTRSPYDDPIKLENPSQPEHWEYCAYGVVNDLEIGQPSDVVEVIFGE